MSLANGHKFLAIPGPTNIPEQVLRAMHRPAIDVYDGELVDICDSLHSDYKRLFRTQSDHVYTYISNGHGGWEAALSNTLSRGDRVLVLESGRFALAWGETARKMGLDVEILKGDFRRAVNPDALEARLAEDKDQQIRAILVVQIDTASGVRNDIEALGRVIRKARHPALFIVDVIASLGCVPFEFDAWAVDIALAASQKGLMSPPGLSLMAVNSRTRKLCGQGDLNTAYWDWNGKESPVFYQRFTGTPPVHLLFALRRALTMLLDEEGLQNAWERHSVLAAAARAAVQAWATGANKQSAVNFNITNPSDRCDTVTTVVCDPACRAEDLRNFVRDEAGLTIGAGIGQKESNGFRIAHMGHINAPMLLGTLATLEMGMKSLDWDIGDTGVKASIDHLAGQFRKPA